jgi:hypothetical protein
MNSICYLRTTVAESQANDESEPIKPGQTGAASQTWRQAACKYFKMNGLQKLNGFSRVKVSQSQSNRWRQKYDEGRKIRCPIFLPNPSFCHQL